MKEPLTWHQNEYLNVVEKLRKKKLDFVPWRDAPVKSIHSVQENPRSICRDVYDFIRNNLIIAPENDVKLGVLKTVKLSQNGLDKLVMAQEEYNANLLFTHLAALLPKSSVLYLGEPGSGKTTSPEIVTHKLFNIPLEKIQEATIYGNPEITNSEVLAYTDLAQLVKNGVELIHPRGFMKSRVRIIDEVNRIPPSKLSILYQVADRGFATHKNIKITAPPGPLFATANFKDSGNYEVPKPFLDRFDISLNTRYLNSAYIRALSKNKEVNNRYVNPSDLEQIQKEIVSTDWDNEAAARLVFFLAEINSCQYGGRNIEQKTKSNLRERKPGEICENCHCSSEYSVCNKTVEGLSPRTYQSIDKFAKALSWWRGNSKVTTEELGVVLPYALSHKIMPTSHATDEIYENDRVSFVSDLWQKSCANYEKASQTVPILKDIAAIIKDFKEGIKSKITKKTIDDALENELSKLDSPAKYDLAIALYDIRKKL